MTPQNTKAKMNKKLDPKPRVNKTKRQLGKNICQPHICLGVFIQKYKGLTQLKARRQSDFNGQVSE
jgi:hypothetical protein